MVKNVFITFVVLCSMTLVVSCGSQAPVNEGQITPEKLGEVGAQIYQSPDNSREILSDAGLTQEEFEQRVEDVTSDPEKANRYRRSFESNL